MGQGLQLREVDSVRLDSWKEIASFLHRDARTVRRWERERKLPVHRVPGGERSGVFAYVAELEEWLHTADRLPDTVAPVKIALFPAKTRASADGSSDLIDEAAETPLPSDGSAAPIANQCTDAVDSGSPTVAASPAVEPTASSEVQAEVQAEVQSGLKSALHSINTLAGNFAADQSTVPEPSVATRPGNTAAFEAGQRLPAASHTFAYQAISLLALAAIAVGVTFALVHHRDAQRSAAAVHRPTPEAQDLYLRGRYNWNLRTEAGLTSAVDLFTQAIVNDPRYARAYAGLADSYLLLRQYGHMPNSEAYPRALAAARQAIALDDSCPDAHRSLAFILRFWNWDMPAAEQEYRRAIALDPNDSQSHHWYATALLSSGRVREALEQIDIARTLEPQSVSVLADRGLILAMSDPADPRAGLTELQQVEQSQPAFLSTHVYLSNIYLSLGDYNNFLAEAQTVAQLNHETEKGAALDRARQVLATRGAPPMLRALANDLGPLTDRGSIPAYDVAKLYGLAGERQQAIHYLRLACDRREPGFIGFADDPAFNVVRSSPEYRSLLAMHDAALPGAKEPVAKLDLSSPF